MCPSVHRALAWCSHWFLGGPLILPAQDQCLKVLDSAYTARCQCSELYEHMIS